MVETLEGEGLRAHVGIATVQPREEDAVRGGLLSSD